MDEKSSPKRCAGQGDILAGLICQAVIWYKKQNNNLNILDYIALSSIICRACSYCAFEKIS